ncbi:uncharacterized protein DUF4239 [Nocardia tenerifensis]|uniref:Uncharacterized protein DUF4239 n=1 Tax=Nocardia tenerifensis TaxID=228006 RepID=A0A318JWK2_9NOCA|nr:DUF4239 domain-containing protein [Nocardia tenerifensis]PXX60979.1 uncharacterized protein DUF4239 [Nocardia tenerifensis]
MDRELVQSVVVPVVIGVVAVIIFVVGNRLRPKSWHHTGEEAQGHLVIDLINTLFLAVAAFVVVISWQQYDNAHNHTIAESKALIDVYWTAHSLPEPQHEQVQKLVHDYTEQVVTVEWREMDDKGRLNQSTQDTLDTLRDTVLAIDSPDSTVTDLRDKAVSSLDEVAQARADRAMDADLSMPGFLYVSLWFTAILLLFSAVLSGIEVTRRSIAMAALLGIVVGAAIVAIYGLDRPFSGASIVSKDAYELALSRYQHIT